jgi:hypothetical protein
MEIFYITAFIFLSLASAITSGWLAGRTGKNPRFWFWLSVALPVIGLCILLCLRKKPKGRINVLRAVKNDELFDHLFINEHSKAGANHENQFSARA